MRSFSLVGLLVTVCIGLLIFAKFEKPAIDTQKQIKPKVEQMAGRDENGEAAGRSFALKPHYATDGKLRGWVVTSIDDGGAMQKHYGLKVGDEVTKIGDQDAATFGDDQGTASIQQYGFQANAPLTVVRDGQTITLPQGASPDGGGMPNLVPHIPIPGQQ